MKDSKSAKAVLDSTVAAYSAKNLNGPDKFTARMVADTLGSTENVVFLPVTDTTVVACMCISGDKLDKAQHFLKIFKLGLPSLLSKN